MVLYPPQGIQSQNQAEKIILLSVERLIPGPHALQRRDTT